MPVDAAGFQHAVKYGLQKRTKQCLDQMKEKLEDHVNDLQILVGRECQEHLAQLWPLILRKAGVQADLPMPPPDHLESMWPFLARAVTTTPKANRFESLQFAMRTWPQQLYYFLPSSGNCKERAKSFLADKLLSQGIQT